MVTTVDTRSQRGMTLIEVMVALIVASIGLLGTLALMGTIVRGGDYSRRVTEASVLLQYKLEEYTIKPYLNLPGDGTLCSPAGTVLPDADTVNALAQSPAGLQPGQAYTRTTYVCTFTDATGTRRRVTTTVSWTDNFNRPHSITASRERVPI